MRRYHVLKGTLIGLALGFLCGGEPTDLLVGAAAGAAIGGIVEFVGYAWPLDPPSWSR